MFTLHLYINKKTKKLEFRKVGFNYYPGGMCSLTYELIGVGL